MLLGQEVQRVERFGLGFGDGRDVRGAREALKAGEGAAGVLDDEALGGGGGGSLVVEEGAGYVGFGFVAEAGGGCQSGKTGGRWD